MDPPHPDAKAAAVFGLSRARRSTAAPGGCGKTDALLMGAVAYVAVPGYAALLFRRSFADLSLPGALMDRTHD